MGTAQALAFPKPSLLQAFFCGRSDYFRALLDDHFRENEGLEASGGLPAITLHGLSPHVFTHVLYYIYTNHTEVRTGVGCVYCARAGGGGHNGQDRYTAHVSGGLQGSTQDLIGSEGQVFHEAAERMWGSFRFFFQAEGPH